MSESAPPTTLSYATALPARRVRFVVWVVCVSALLGGSIVWLFRLRDQGTLVSDTTLIVGWATLAAAILLIWLLLKTSPSDAIRLPRAASYWIICAGSASLQAVAIMMLIPALSEDVLRYRLDGRMWLERISPYAVTPERYLDTLWTSAARLFRDGPDRLVRHSDLHSIYPPTAQAVFVVGRAVEDSLLPPTTAPGPRNDDWRSGLYYVPKTNHALVHRATVAAFSIWCILVLLKVHHFSQASPWYAMLLAWHPLAVLETGGMGHVDIVGVLFVLLAIRALQAKRPILAAAMLALAAGVKPHVVLLAPFLVRDALRAWHGFSTRAEPPARVENPCHKRAVIVMLAFIGFLAIVYSPMLYQRGYEGWLRTSKIYATSWEANGSIYDVIKATGDETDGWSVQRAKDRARLLGGAMAIATMLIAWLARADLPTAGYWIFLVALLVSPVVYPWYLLWVLCFVPLLRGWQGMTALVWAATIGVSYLLWRTSEWVLPTRWLLVEYVPVYAVLIVEMGVMLCVKREDVKT